MRDVNFESTIIVENETVALTIIHQKRFPLIESSKALQSAVAGLASNSITRGGSQSREDAQRFIFQCMEQTQIEIDTFPTVALVYVCFILLRINLLINVGSFDDYFIHLGGMHAVRMHLLESNSIAVESSEWSWIEALWVEALVSVYSQLSPMACR